MSTDYSLIDNNFSKNSKKIKSLGEGTFGRVFLCDTPNGTFVTKETKINNKSLGYPSDFLTEIDILLKFRKLPNIIKLQGIIFDVDQKKGCILLEVMSSNLSEWSKITPFDQKIQILPQLIKDLHTTLAILHTFQFIHNDIKTNNILVDTTSSPTKFKLADFGKAARIKDENIISYGAIEKYQPPSVRNVYSCEYWALMVVVTEVILGTRMVFMDDAKSFYSYYSKAGEFQIQRFLQEKLKPQDFARIPDEYWNFVYPIIRNKNAKLVTILEENYPYDLMRSIDQDISKSNERHHQFDMIKEEFKYILASLKLFDYYQRFSRLLNKFLSSLNEPLELTTLKCYAEIALSIVLKSKHRSYIYFKSEKEFLLFQRAFLHKIGYQTVIL